MSSFALSPRSLTNLKGVQHDLVAVVKATIAITPVDFGITEGLRTLERQRELFAAKATRTMKSRHLTGHAVDVAAYVGGTVRWDWPLYAEIASAMKRTGEKLSIPIEWGGDWKTFPDGPHFQLPWESYSLDP